MQRSEAEERGGMEARGALHRRNAAYVDAWSFVHLSTGVLLAWVFHPVLAWIVMALWEPLEIFVVHPIVYRLTGFHFGYESLRNSLSDIVFNTLGILIGFFLVRALLPPPFSWP